MLKRRQGLFIFEALNSAKHIRQHHFQADLILKESVDKSESDLGSKYSITVNISEYLFALRRIKRFYSFIRIKANLFILHRKIIEKEAVC
jgi:hypothetical protein